jgi:hypothetical protein
MRIMKREKSRIKNGDTRGIKFKAGKIINRDKGQSGIQKQSRLKDMRDKGPSRKKDKAV